MGGGGGGTHSKVCNSVTIDIWNWAIERGIWLSAAYILVQKMKLLTTSRAIFMTTQNGL